jgi:superfamily II RNA helicase
VVVMVYRPAFNYKDVKSIVSDDVEPIKSQFRISVNTVLNLIQRHPEKEIERILRLSFSSYQQFGQDYEKIPSKLLLATYNNIVKKLRTYGYVRQDQLTEKGEFSAKVFADEITLGEIFATPFADNLDEYQILLVLAALVYESRENDQFKKEFKTSELKQLEKELVRSDYLRRERKFESLRKITALIDPVYRGEDFFEVIGNTNLLEGDLMRFYAQILDRIGQIRKASADFALLQKMENCKSIVERALEKIYLI